VSRHFASDAQAFKFPWTPGNKSTGLSLVMWDDDEDEGDTHDFLGKLDLSGTARVAIQHAT
jgi:hypothetical protein